MSQCKKCGKFIGKNHHICAGLAWNSGKTKETDQRINYDRPTSFKKGQIGLRLGKKASKETKIKLRKSHLGQRAWNEGIKQLQTTGDKNPNWKGGITPENHKIRTSLEMKLWRKAVFERDNFICQKTSIVGGKLHPHHINNFADFPELRLAIDNGITLSEKSHKEFHKRYGNKNNTREQLLIFLDKKYGNKI